MSFIFLGILNSQVATIESGYFIALYGTDENDTNGRTKVGSDGNLYGVFSTVVSGSTGEFCIFSTNSNGVIRWSRRLGGASNEQHGNLALDSSDNVYLVGTSSSAGSGNQDMFAAKYNSAGTIQWQRALNHDSIESGRGITVDSSGNVYLAGQTRLIGGDDFTVVKLDTTPSIGWQLTVGDSGNQQAFGVVRDGSGNLFAAGFTIAFGTFNERFLITKINESTGALTWQRALGTDDELAEDVAVDSSGNVYVVGANNSANLGIITKYNTSGTIQWQKTLTVGTTGSFRRIAIDSDDNIYVVGNATVSSTLEALIVKYDTSGDVVWQRTFGGTDTQRGQGIAIDGDNNIVITASTDNGGIGNTDSMILKFPPDGSKTGTYDLNGVNYTYQSSSFTENTSTYTPSTTTFSTTASGLSLTTPTLTDQAITLTEYKTTI
jgi:hypothetical protein